MGKRYEERWVRDDGWTIRVVRGIDGYVSVSRMPGFMVVPPEPLTYEYVKKVLQAHGYGKVGD